MKARIDFERCTGHGRCYALCPEVFAEDDNGYPVLDDSPIPDDLAARVRRAADNCPESAITLLSLEESSAEKSSTEKSGTEEGSAKESGTEESSAEENSSEESDG